MNSNNTLLSINNYYYLRGGAEFVFFEQNKLFENIDWKVIPFAMHHPNNEDSSWSKYFIDEIEFGNNYSLIEKLSRASKVIYSLEAQKKINALINDVNPSICHAHNVYHHISPSIFSVLKKNDIPTVLTLHDLKLACPAYKMLTHDGICERCNRGSLINVVKHKCVKNSNILSLVAYLESTLHKAMSSYVNNIDRFVVPSKFYLEKFVEWGFNRKNFIHIPNFVDINKYQASYSGGKSYMYFGRLGHEKGLSTLIKAASIANVSLIFAGTGPEEIKLKQLADKLRVKVQFLGYLTGEDLYTAIRSSRAVVLPSEWYENAPISLIEAYALGKPVIGASIGGITELIKENITGYGFISGSSESLASALTKMSDCSDSDIENMGSAGRTWVEEEFTAQIYRDNLLTLYQSLNTQIKL